MDIKEYLLQARLMDMAINAKQAQILELRKHSPQSSGILSFSRSADGKSSAISAAERLVEKLALEEEKLNAMIDEYVDKKNEIAAFIARIEDIEMRTLLEYHYLCGESWENVADKMYISIRNVYYLHKKAIAILEEKPA